MDTYHPIMRRQCGCFFICLLLFGSIGAVMASAQPDNASPTTTQISVSEETPDAAASRDAEEQVREARSRISFRIYLTSAILGTILIICLATWANRRHRKRLEALKQDPDASLWP